MFVYTIHFANAQNLTIGNLSMSERHAATSLKAVGQRSQEMTKQHISTAIGLAIVRIREKE